MANNYTRNATSYPHRDAIIVGQYMEYGNENTIFTIDDIYLEVYGPSGPTPDGRLDGCFLNYADNLAGTDTGKLYWAENYPKLQQVKGIWDPLNIFINSLSPVGIPVNTTQSSSEDDVLFIVVGSVVGGCFIILVIGLLVYLGIVRKCNGFESY